MRSRFVVLIAGCCAALFSIAAHAQAPRVPAYKTFKQWEVGCDNLRGCIAIGSPQREGESGYIRIRMEAGANAKPDVKIVLGEDEAEDFKIVDPSPEAGATGIAALLAAARKADAVTIADADGKRKTRFSLAGAAAALLFIDDAQGRIGTVTALARPGAKPATAVPAPPTAPVVKPVATASFGAADEKIAAALRKAMKARLAKDCSFIENRSTDEGGEAWRVGKGLTLVALPCDSGAYNFSSRFFLVRDGKVALAQPVNFPDPIDALGAGLTNAEFSSESGAIDFFAKGRGVGDCGIAGSYAWTGAAFALTAYRRLDACRGIDPDDWPVLWRIAG